MSKVNTCLQGVGMYLRTCPLPFLLDLPNPCCLVSLLFFSSVMSYCLPIAVKDFSSIKTPQQWGKAPPASYCWSLSPQPGKTPAVKRGSSRWRQREKALSFPTVSHPARIFPCLSERLRQWGAAETFPHCLLSARAFHQHI